MSPEPEPVEGGHWHGLARRALARFTSKCRKMSQNVALFRPPLVNPCNLRVENLTIWADSRPFSPISVHFRLTRRHSRAQTPVILVPRHGNPCPARAALPLPVTPPARPFAGEHEREDARIPRSSPPPSPLRASALPYADSATRGVIVLIDAPADHLTPPKVVAASYRVTRKGVILHPDGSEAILLVDWGRRSASGSRSR